VYSNCDLINFNKFQHRVPTATTFIEHCSNRYQKMNQNAGKACPYGPCCFPDTTTSWEKILLSCPVTFTFLFLLFCFSKRQWWKWLLLTTQIYSEWVSKKWVNDTFQDELGGDTQEEAPAVDHVLARIYFYFYRPLDDGCSRSITVDHNRFCSFVHLQTKLSR